MSAYKQRSRPNKFNNSYECQWIKMFLQAFLKVFWGGKRTKGKEGKGIGGSRREKRGRREIRRMMNLKLFPTRLRYDDTTLCRHHRSATGGRWLDDNWQACIGTAATGHNLRNRKNSSKISINSNRPACVSSLSRPKTRTDWTENSFQHCVSSPSKSLLIEFYETKRNNDSFRQVSLTKIRDIMP